MSNDYRALVFLKNCLAHSVLEPNYPASVVGGGLVL